MTTHAKVFAYCLFALASSVLNAQESRANDQNSTPADAHEWKFVVSGDSRNCGDVIMPMIAEAAAAEHAVFYWHLGDLRAIYKPDEDMGKFDPSWHIPVPTLDKDSYYEAAWNDFEQKQAVPFEKRGVQFFLGIGNHETIPPNSRERFRERFQDLLNIARLKDQRIKDKDATPATYYHWIQDGIDFIYLDNASDEQFDAQQMKWILARIDHDRNDPSIWALVVGMHKALPGSFSDFHSMSETPAGLQSGRCVYRKLLDLRNDSKKQVYILASHSHFFMKDIYDTPYWRNVGVLQGWIVGTAGAVRYRLPAELPVGIAKTDVYGYLVGTVNPGRFASSSRKFPSPVTPMIPRSTKIFLTSVSTGTKICRAARTFHPHRQLTVRSVEIVSPDFNSWKIPLLNLKTSERAANLTPFLGL